MRPRIPPLPIVVATLAALLAGFAYGLIVAKTKIPPYQTIRRVAASLHLMPEGTAARGASRPPWASDEGWPGDAKAIHEAGDDAGRWLPAPPAATTRTAQQDSALKERLAALGYVSGYEEATGRENVTLFRPDLASQGLNLYLSGHAPEAILIDMEGRFLHRWHLDFDDAFPARPHHEKQWNLEFWRRIHPFPNGDLLAIFEDGGIVKIDRDSRLLWAVPGRYHHEAVVDDAGLIHALLREERWVPWIDETDPVFDDLIVVLDAEGRPVRRISILDALADSPYAALLGNLPDGEDIFHTNTIQRLDGRHAAKAPAFREGNYLVSIRRLDTIAIVDAETERVVWALSGLWVGQHEPTLLDNGRMLIFDNLGHGGKSQVLEFDPLTQEVIWAFRGDEENGFFSATCGAVQRLPNGNTLISESDAGRAFELTADHEMAWDFYNPHRAGDNGELVATLFEVVRLPPEFGNDWLEEADAGAPASVRASQAADRQ